jgi:hypothetical protein
MKTRQTIKRKYLLWKRRVADTLQLKSERLSPRGKKALLFLFCVFFAGFNIMAVVQAFTTKAKPGLANAKMPRVIQQKETPVLPFISRQEYERIEHFKNYIMQLPKPSLDSFTQARPRLMDSILQIENYYQSQNKK